MFQRQHGGMSPPSACGQDSAGRRTVIDVSLLLISSASLRSRRRGVCLTGPNQLINLMYTVTSKPMVGMAKGLMSLPVVCAACTLRGSALPHGLRTSLSHLSPSATKANMLQLLLAVMRPYLAASWNHCRACFAAGVIVNVIADGDCEVRILQIYVKLILCTDYGAMNAGDANHRGTGSSCWRDSCTNARLPL